MKDIFDEAWNGYSHITEAYPYASMKFSIGLEDGLDKSGRLTTFADGDMTVFADSDRFRHRQIEHIPLFPMDRPSSLFLRRAVLLLFPINLLT